MTQLSKFTKSIGEEILNPATKIQQRPYVAITENVEITVWPEFIDSKSSILGDLFIWAYHVRVDNKSSEAVKLTNRYWRIIDEKGLAQEVMGEGVVGEQPLIAAGSSYQYNSGVHLRYPSGIMTGHYQMQKASGKIFNAKIPAFSLDVPSIKPVIN
jgi:ApaG protein